MLVLVVSPAIADHNRAVKERESRERYDNLVVFGGEDNILQAIPIGLDIGVAGGTVSS